ncbi:MAG: S41 family peptidase [Pseudomonadota bacterium]|nr:S41 family peptidase [Pseudomonadota bacterium]
MKVDALFDDLAQRLRTAPDKQAARAVFERLERRVGDGHVRIEWPMPARPAAAAAAASPQPDLCASIGYDARQNGPGTADRLAGYQPLQPADGNAFAAGTFASVGVPVGVVRIGVFQPKGYPELCRSAVQALAIPVGKPCDDECQNRIVTWAYRRMGEMLEQRLRQLKAAGTEVLLVDISRNGGGSEWTEAAARMLTARQLVSARMGFVRGEHWVKQWRDLAANLRGHAAKASPEDRQRLLSWAAEADAAKRNAQTPCPPASPSCSNVAMAGFSTGLVGAARAGTFSGKDWGVYVFNPAQHYYSDGVWSRPLIVLTDEETWSAAEQFAALLQDNRVAVVLGARTGGAGCGYTWGGHPTTLKNSGAVLQLPDCVRFRADGSNEVRGVMPDVLTGARATDGAGLRARLTAERLPAAIAQARALNAGK